MDLESGGETSSVPPGISTCLLCGERIEIEDPRNWKQVVGWVGGPKKDSMRLREDTGYIAHDACVKKLQDGQAIDQPSLFEDNPVEEQKATRPHLPSMFTDDGSMGHPGGHYG